MYHKICDLFDTHDTVYFGATLVNSKKRIPFLQSIKDMCKHKFVIDVVVVPCDDKISKKRITKDLNEGVKRANSINLIHRQYNQYLHTMSGVLDDERDFYRKIKIVGE